MKDYYRHKPYRKYKKHHHRSPSSVLVLLIYAAVVLVIPITSCVAKYEDSTSTYSYRYVPDIEDLPIPEGFEVRDDLSTSFDTAEGRIVDTYLEGDDKPENLEKFYSEVLPALGWEKTSLYVYQRDEERMEFNIYPNKNKVMLHFIIRPLDADI